MKQYIYSSQSSLWGEPELLGFGSNEFYIKEIDRNLANDIIVKNHYSKKFYNATYIHLGLFVNEETHSAQPGIKTSSAILSLI